MLALKGYLDATFQQFQDKWHAPSYTVSSIMHQNAERSIKVYVRENKQRFSALTVKILRLLSVLMTLHTLEVS